LPVQGGSPWRGPGAEPLAFLVLIIPRAGLQDEQA
jgi:hypothetical protein